MSKGNKNSILHLTCVSEIVQIKRCVFNFERNSKTIDDQVKIRHTHNIQDSGIGRNDIGDRRKVLQLIGLIPTRVNVGRSISEEQMKVRGGTVGTQPLVERNRIAKPHEKPIVNAVVQCGDRISRSRQIAIHPSSSWRPFAHVLHSSRHPNNRQCVLQRIPNHTGRRFWHVGKTIAKSLTAASTRSGQGANRNTLKNKKKKNQRNPQKRGNL